MVTSTPYETEPPMAEQTIPEATLHALRTFLWTHGITTSLAAMGEILGTFGPAWKHTTHQINQAVLRIPATSIEERRNLLGQCTIRVAYPDSRAKLDTIKAVRTGLDIGLKEAKDFTELAHDHGAHADFEILARLNREMERKGLVTRFTAE